MNIAVIANPDVFHREVSDSLKRHHRLYTFKENFYEVKTTKFIRVASIDDVKGKEFDGFIDIIARHDNQHYYEVQEYFKHSYHKEYHVDEIGGLPDGQ
jgi:hypothetical protein